MNLLAGRLGVLVLGQATAEPAVDPSSVEVQSVWDFVVKGGPMMIPIIGCSLIALAVFVERVISLRRANVIPPDFLPGLRNALKDDDPSRSKARKYCRDDASPVANILLAGIKKLGRSLELVERHIQQAGEREVIKLRKYLRLFIVIAAIAPLMGLLGTILGMIKAFQTVAVSGDALGKTELLATGIYEAMITTAAGLLLAIPVLVAYHWISARVEHLVIEMDQMSVDFIDRYASTPAGPAVVAETSQRVEDAQVARPTVEQATKGEAEVVEAAEAVA